MIAWLALRLARWGLSQRVAARVAPVALAVGLLALLGAVAGLWLHFHDRGVIAAHEAAQVARAAPAAEQAASERAADTLVLTRQEDRYHDAIEQSADSGVPGPAAVALNCERLRRAGIPLPPACGPDRGDRAKAGADR